MTFPFSDYDLPDIPIQTYANIKSKSYDIIEACTDSVKADFSIRDPSATNAIESMIPNYAGDFLSPHAIQSIPSILSILPILP